MSALYENAYVLNVLSDDHPGIIAAVGEMVTVLGGNMRLLALRKIGAKDCTAKIVRGLTAEQKREFVIKDNSQFGENDWDALANNWSDLPLVDWGVDLPKAWSHEPLDQSEDPASNEPEKSQIIICPKCSHEFSVLRENN